LRGINTLHSKITQIKSDYDSITHQVSPLKSYIIKKEEELRDISDRKDELNASIYKAKNTLLPASRKLLNTLIYEKIRNATTASIESYNTESME
jgi:SMC interacting uncharacterized protein involved in chromosome segregation